MVAAVAIGVAVLAWAADVQASCRVVGTYIVNGRITYCTACCYGSIARTHCH